MLNLSVCRQDKTVLESENEYTAVFYDETLKIYLRSEQICEIHLSLTVVGGFQDKGREHSIVIYNENLKKGTVWEETFHIKHPRTPLSNPFLEIVVTARYAAEDQVRTLTNQNPERLHLTPLHPIPSNHPGFIVPFDYCVNQQTDVKSPQSSDHVQVTSATSSIDFTGAYEERSSQKRSEFVASNLFTSENTEISKGDDSGIEIVRWKAPLVQALELEIRSLRPALEKDRVIAEIDLVSGSNNIRVNACTVQLDGGIAELMGDISLPVDLSAKEKFAFAYNLQLRVASQASQLVQSSRKPLSLTLEYEVQFENSNCRPSITTLWMPIVDFEGTQGPVPKTPAMNIPAFSPMPAFSGNGLGAGNSSTTLDLVSGPRSQTSSSNLSLMGGVAILITGPQFVKVGDTFEWNLKVMNRSQRNRMFTMIFGNLPRCVLKHDDNMDLDRMSVLSNYNAEYLRKRSATQYYSSRSSRGIVPLCHDLKIGNLAPSVCFETTIQLHALRIGTHTIEAAKIEDLTTRDSYDVGGLLEVIVEPRD